MKGYELMILCKTINPETIDCCYNCPGKLIACPQFSKDCTKIFEPSDLDEIMFVKDYGTLSLTEALLRTRTDE